MTLHKFTTLTSRIPDTMLRRAVAAALANGAPRRAEEFARFHDDILDELRLASYQATDRAASAESTHGTPGSATGASSQGASTCAGAA